MASDEVVKWAGAFSPRLFTKTQVVTQDPSDVGPPPGQDLEHTTPADPTFDTGGNVGDSPVYRLINTQDVSLDNGAIETYAYIGVLFNHDCGHDGPDHDVPSNHHEYVYEVRLPVGQSAQDMFRDEFENETLPPEDKLKFLAQNSTDAIDRYDILRIRREAGVEADVPVGSKTTVDRLLGNL